MNRTKFTLWACIGLLCGVVACSDLNPDEEQLPDGMLWRLSSVEQQQSSILGSMTLFDTAKEAFGEYVETVNSLAENFTELYADFEAKQELLSADLATNADLAEAWQKAGLAMEELASRLSTQCEELHEATQVVENIGEDLKLCAESLGESQEWLDFSLSTIEYSHSLYYAWGKAESFKEVMESYLPEFELRWQLYLTGKLLPAANTTSESIHDIIYDYTTEVSTAIESLGKHFVDSDQLSYSSATDALTKEMEAWVGKNLNGCSKTAPFEARLEVLGTTPKAQTSAEVRRVLQNSATSLENIHNTLTSTYRQIIKDIIDNGGLASKELDSSLQTINLRTNRLVMEESLMVDALFVQSATDNNEEDASLTKTMEECITLTVDHFDGRFDLGEEVAIRAVVPARFTAIQEVWINGLLDSTYTSTKSFPKGVYNMMVRKDMEPTTVMVRLTNPNNSKDVTEIGYCSGLEHFRPGFTKPADFYDWWMEQVEMLRALPIEATLTEVEVPSGYASSYVCYDLEVNCGEGGAPVRGYMAMPKGADVGSLPICIFTHGAGVNGSANQSRIDVALQYARQGGGSIALDLNAHGMLNGQPQSYYDNLNNTTLKNYRYWAIESRDTYYFRGMFLRLQRALDYMCTRAEWDGERVLIVGSSQGGAQTAAICGLDNRVTHAVIRAPAMMDQGGSLVGRRGGWPYLPERYGLTEAFMSDAPYFDTAFFLEHNTAKLLYEFGWIDPTCPPCTVAVGYNLAAGGDKTLYTYPYRAHSTPKGKYKEAWNKYINANVNAFINDALK